MTAKQCSVRVKHGQHEWGEYRPRPGGKAEPYSYWCAGIDLTKEAPSG